MDLFKIFTIDTYLTFKNRDARTQETKDVLYTTAIGVFVIAHSKEAVPEATRAKLAEHPVEKVGAGLRALMPWIAKKKLIDSDKN